MAPIKKCIRGLILALMLSLGLLLHQQFFFRSPLLAVGYRRRDL